MKLYRDKEWLREKYIDEKLSGQEIAILAECSGSTVLHWLTRYCIPRRGPGKTIGKWITPIKERFWSKVNKSGDCWEWKSCHFVTGYGAFSINSQAHYAHRVAWELTNGPIPEGMHCLHRCDNPGCVNPSHLFLGNQSDNNKDCVVKARNARGERNGQSKLTEARVLEIRRLAAETSLTQQEIGERYLVSRGHVGSIIRHDCWKHI